MILTYYEVFHNLQETNLQWETFWSDHLNQIGGNIRVDLFNSNICFCTSREYFLKSWAQYIDWFRRIQIFSCTHMYTQNKGCLFGQIWNVIFLLCPKKTEWNICLSFDIKQLSHKWMIFCLNYLFVIASVGNIMTSKYLKTIISILYYQVSFKFSINPILINYLHRQKNYRKWIQNLNKQ